VEDIQANGQVKPDRTAVSSETSRPDQQRRMLATAAMNPRCQSISRTDNEEQDWASGNAYRSE